MFHLEMVEVDFSDVINNIGCSDLSLMLTVGILYRVVRCNFQVDLVGSIDLQVRYDNSLTPE